MAKVDLPDLIALWEKATPIQDARFRYAPAHLLEQLAQNPAPNPMNIAQVQTNGAAAPKVATNHELLGRMQDFNARLQRHNDAMAGIDAHFWAMLYDGSLTCLAFEAPRSVAARPVKVPQMTMDRYPDWKTGTYRHDGLHLVELRVIDSDRVGLKPVADAPAPAGRPSFKAEILAAYAALQADGTFKAKPLTHGIEQIRTWIRVNRPESRAAQALLGHDTIRNAIKPLLADGSGERVEKL